MAVYKKGNRWYVSVYDSNGKRVRRVVKIDGKDPATLTRQDALKAEAITKGEIAQGTFNIPSSRSNIAFDKLADLYLEWADKNHKAPELDHYKVKILKEFFGGMKINNINLWIVEKFTSKRKTLGRMPETINKELGILRRMFNLAKDWGIITTNPIEGMKLIKVQNKPFRVLKDWEFQKLYDPAPQYFKDILLCAYLTGMRRSEIRKLKWENVDIEQANISVVETKNYECRNVPINSVLLQRLKELTKQSKSEYVFTTPNGEPYVSNTSWKRVWKTTLENSDIKKCRFHDLRHTFATNLILSGVDLVTVQQLCGWKSIDMVMRYAHSNRDQKKKAVESLNSPVVATYPYTSEESDKVSYIDNVR